MFQILNIFKVIVTCLIFCINFIVHVCIIFQKKKHCLAELEYIFGQICGIIEEELGKTMDDLFSDIVKVPLATASARSFTDLFSLPGHFCERPLPLHLLMLAHLPHKLLQR